MSGSKQFTRVSNLHPRKNLFDLTHSLKADHDFGYIYPVMIKQCVPGDVIRLGIKNVTRMNPSVVPFAHQIDVNYYTFFVPYRILDFAQVPNLFETVISGGITGNEERDFPRFNFETTSSSGYSAYGYIRNVYSLASFLSEAVDGQSYYPSSSSTSQTSFRFYPLSSDDEDSYLEPSYLYPNPQGVSSIADSSDALKIAFGLHSLSDYLGLIPPQAFGITDASDDYTANASGILTKILAYPWYAYNKVYIDYFADENIESSLFNDPSGVQDNGDFFIHANSVLMRCNWEKDYFSSALPWQQRGDAPAIDVGALTSWSNLTLPDSVATTSNTEVSGTSDSGEQSYSYFNYNYGSGTDDDSSFTVKYNLDMYGGPQFGFVNYATGSGSNASTAYSAVTGANASTALVYNSSGTKSLSGSKSVPPNSNSNVYAAYLTGAPLGVSLDGLTGSFDIAQLRNALSIQHFMERNARSGVRYTEFLRSHFGISPRDSRLQRAEYLGGTKSNILVSEVMQTSETTSTGGTSGTLGDFAGKGIMAMDDGFVVKNYHCEEFGCILVVMTIRPKPAYSQGVPREWLYGDRYSWFFPEFQNLSEQAIMNMELFLTEETTSTEAESVFGYQGIYDELRTAQDRVAGELRDTLDYWHLARSFDDMPSLSYDFIKVMPYSDDLHRVFAYEGTASNPVCPFVMTHVFSLSMLRPITFMPNPGVSYV